jgi:hypothetical protein
MPVLRWEEDPVRNRLWWLIKYDDASHGTWCACIGLLADGSFHGFLVGDRSADEDDMSAGPAFGSFEEGRMLLEVEAKLEGIC